MQKPLRELGRLCLGATGQANHPVIVTEVCTEPRGGLPLLQVWPSDSPRGEADGQAFIFPDVQENVNDSGIESIQRLAIGPVRKASPSPTCGGGSSSSPTNAIGGSPNGSGGSPLISPNGINNGGPAAVVIVSSPATTPQQSRRPSLLHPDHARLSLHHHHHGHHHHHHYHEKRAAAACSSPDRASIDEDERQQPPSPSSSTTSSLRSMPSSAMTSMHSHDRRRSSRFSMFDALDLEYALRRAAARGSVGTYSFSESLHKLTFTQSLAFPALARNLAHKQAGVQSGARQPQQHGESGMNVFAKVVTALVLVLVSFLVFGVVYKFVRT